MSHNENTNAANNDILSAIMESSREVIMFALDTNYHYLAFNRKHKEAIREIWGKDIEIGMNMLDVIGKHEDNKKAKINYDRVLAGESFTLIEEFGDEKLSRLFWQDFWSPIVSNGGKITGLVCFCLNITERKQAEEKIQRSERLLRESQKVAHIGSYENNLLNNTWESSEETDRIYGIDKTYLRTLDGWVNIIHPDWRQKLFDYVSRVYSEKIPFDYEYKIIRINDKKECWVHGLGKIQVDNEGNGICMIGTIQDITEKKKVYDALKESERQLSNAIDNAPIPIMLRAEDGEVLKISREWTKITGYTIEDIPTTSKWAEKAYGENSLAVIALIKDSYSPDSLKAEGEYKIITAKGEERIWKLIASNIGNTYNGRKLAMTAATDITERIKMETVRKQEQKLLKTTLLSIGDGVISTDSNGKIVLLNKVAEVLTGWTNEEASGKPIEEVFNIINEYTREKSENIVKKVLKSGKTQELANHTILISKDGIERPIEDSAAPIMQENQDIVGMVLVFRDVSDKKERQEEIEFLSYHDQLTGLYNRRFYKAELKRLDIEKNLPLTIVMGDVNGLKLINDSFGHDLGDDLLKKVAEVLRRGCRADDIIARLGGDEFVIILPRTDSQLAEKIVKRINVLTLKEKICSLDVSISFGYETKISATEKIEEIFKNAEDHMYNNKLFEGPSMRGRAISAITRTLHGKNKMEEQHSNRVSELCKEMGKAIGLTEHEIQKLKTVGLLHDIGKIAIDENILSKPGKLTENEWKEIKRHPEIGYRILSTVIDMTEIANYVLAHHERWDGQGYPKGLKGEQIPLMARIISIADTYDAMTSERSYKSALPKEIAIKELQKNAGTQFDPKLVSVFIELCHGDGSKML